MLRSGVSIIICTYNGAKKIIPTLEAIAKQNIPEGVNCELLLVDNASADSTQAIAAEHWKKLNCSIPFCIVSEPNPGKANALTTGYNKAKYELMLLCDDDNWLQPDYVKTVIEIYSQHPDIGLLGGYGKAFFNPGEKPDWFEKHQFAYVCGKHHTKNGFLKQYNYTIWGAGSVLRKTLWQFLTSNGFYFNHSISAGKAPEDTELSMAITFTGCQLYFDERLWFTHDLSGGRITWKNYIQQQRIVGKSRATLCMYKLAFKNDKTNLPFSIIYIKQVVIIFLGLLYNIVINGTAEIVYYWNTLIELIVHLNKYKKIFYDSIPWIKKIKNTYPLAK